MKILVTDPLARDGVDILKKAGFSVCESGKLSPEELAGRIIGYDALIVRSATRVDRGALEAADRLKIIGRAGVGLDNVDLAAATEKGVIVMNSPEGNTISTAEHAFALVLGLLRNVPQACASVRAGHWEKKLFTGTETAGKVLGIVGFGRIGQRIARYALAFDMKVLACDPFISKRKAVLSDVSLVDLDELLGRADIVTLHLPLTAESRNIIGRAQLAAMKESAFLVNCARGGLVDEAALADALETGRLKGAAFDVFEQEPPAGNRLLAEPRFIATPHLGASTEEAQEKVARDICSQVTDYLTRGLIVNAANLPSVSEKQLEALRPYLCLCEKIGLFLAQMAGGRIEEIGLDYCGEIVEMDLSPLPHYFLKGLLTPSLGSAVNYVNAPLIARQRGVKFTETKSATAPEFSNIVHAWMAAGESAGDRVSISGALFGNNDPRIVKLGDFLVDAIPEGDLLLFRHQDKVGVIGRIGTLLAASGVNIAGMTLGRREKGGTAVAIINVDGVITPALLREAGQLPNVESVKLIKL